MKKLIPAFWGIKPLFVASAAAFLATIVATSFGGCGTATSEGTCKPATASNNTAATQDPWGGDWKMDLTPSSNQDITCASESDKGNIHVVAVIKDSLNSPKPGLAIKGSLTGEAAQKTLGLTSDTNTDSCGTAFFDVSWTCPARGMKRSGTLIVTSGGLSKSIQISVEHRPPLAEATATATAAASTTTTTGTTGN